MLKAQRALDRKSRQARENEVQDDPDLAEGIAASKAAATADQVERMEDLVQLFTNNGAATTRLCDRVCPATGVLQSTSTEGVTLIEDADENSTPGPAAASSAAAPPARAIAAAEIAAAETGTDKEAPEATQQAAATTIQAPESQDAGPPPGTRGGQVES